MKEKQSMWHINYLFILKKMIYLSYENLINNKKNLFHALI